MVCALHAIRERLIVVKNITVLGVHADGGLQEQISVPINLLLPANHLSDDQIAIVEPLAIGAHAIRRSGIETDENVAVVGCGPIGIGIMKLAQIAGANVIALDMNEQRLNYAKDKIGADHVGMWGQCPKRSNRNYQWRFVFYRI